MLREGNLMDFEIADQIVAATIKRTPDLVIQRYVKKHHLLSEPAMSVELVWQHWQTETKLSHELRQSDPITRSTQFERAYGLFYRELYWLNDWKRPSSSDHDEITYGFYTRLLGRAADIYEVGSGKGELISFLASKGYRCVATEITAERGKKWTTDGTNLTWKCSDGVHLAEFEGAGSHDVVISAQVIEHIHPDDLETHFHHAARILRDGGRYIFSTPHKICGPADISEIFDLDEPMGFHLREYSNSELLGMIRAAGFSRVQAIYVTPQKLRRQFSICFASTAYLYLLLGLEAVMATLPKKRRKQVFRLLQLSTLLRRDVFLCLTK
jgi:2-polyprenyl-3-methyl-5-hydroxy-6-metoxy-1,4-benzoquinol methylase